MSNWGAIGTRGNETKALRIGNPVVQFAGLAIKGNETKSTGFVPPAPRFSSLMIGSARFAIGGEDFIQGNPAQPSIRIDAKGSWRFRWAIPLGQHTIAVNVLQAINLTPRPSLMIRANPAIGIALDIETFAPSSTTWTTIGPVSVTTTAVGPVWVELRCNLDTNIGFSPCYFDHVVKT